jgi:hypothetical protein
LSGRPFDPALQNRLERFVGSIVRVEGQVVAEDDEAVRVGPQQAHEIGQGLDVLTVDLDELQGTGFGRPRVVDLRMDSLDQRRLAHAPGAPEEGVVGRQPPGEALGILRQLVPNPVDAAQEAHLDPVHLRHRGEPAPGGLPDEGVGRCKIRVRRSRGSQTLQGSGDARQKRHGFRGVQVCRHLGSGPSRVGERIA